MKNRSWPISAAILLTLGSAALSDDIRIRVNGEPVGFGYSGPIERDGRVLVPLRGVFEKLGAYVDWNQNTRTVIATKDETVIRLPIGSRFANVNGERISLGVPAMTIAGNTMVPLRFVSEALGADVSWDRYSSTVNIDMGTRVAERPHRTFRYEAPAPENYQTSGDGRRPHVISVAHNMAGGVLPAGDTIRVVLRGTPGGTAYFRIRYVVGEVKMREISPGVYEGFYRNREGRDVTIDDRDILAFVVKGNFGSPEVHP